MKPLCIHWVHQRVFSLALGDTNQLVDNWHHINSYLYDVSPIPIRSQTQHIPFMTYIILLGVRTRLSLVDVKDEEAVMYVITETDFLSFSIIHGVDRPIYISDTEMEKKH